MAVATVAPTAPAQLGFGVNVRTPAVAVLPGPTPSAAPTTGQIWPRGNA